MERSSSIARKVDFPLLFNYSLCLFYMLMLMSIFYTLICSYAYVDAYVLMLSLGLFD